MELTSHHQQEEFRKGQKEMSPVPPPRILLAASILLEQCMDHQEGPWVRMTGQRQPETHFITRKPETVSHVTEQSSLVPSACCAPSQSSLLLCQHTCLLGQFTAECQRRVHFWGPRRSYPSCHISRTCEYNKRLSPQASPTSPLAATHYWSSRKTEDRQQGNLCSLCTTVFKLYAHQKTDF